MGGKVMFSQAFVCSQGECPGLVSTKLQIQCSIYTPWTHTPPGHTTPNPSLDIPLPGHTPPGHTIHPWTHQPPTPHTTTTPCWTQQPPPLQPPRYGQPAVGRHPTGILLHELIFLRLSSWNILGKIQHPSSKNSLETRMYPSRMCSNCYSGHIRCQYWQVGQTPSPLMRTSFTCRPFLLGDRMTHASENISIILC